MTGISIPLASMLAIDPAVGSLTALLIVMAVSLTSRLNVGLLAIILAWAVGVGVAAWKTDAILGAFPSSLFLTLLGVTLLFGAAEKNGTLAAITARIIGACGGVVALMPSRSFCWRAAFPPWGPARSQAPRSSLRLRCRPAWPRGCPRFSWR